MIFHFDNSYGKLPESFYVPTNPTQVPDPSVLLFNDNLARELDLSPDNMDMEEAAALFSGNKMIPGSFPIAQAYAGHQFGNFTMLGDGRAILLGEHITKAGNRFDIQLKGSGYTAFSRGGDGRATLRAMLREYLISEAMAGLKIPTTRSLAVVKTGAKVYREEAHEGAILTRIASSHIRVGTFEFANRFVPNESSILLDYVIDRHYPELNLSKSKARDLMEAVMLKQIDLIVQWMRVGFIHGVMNTDNMSIHGITIDYGPYGWLENYDPDWTPNTTDSQNRRYRFGNQPQVAQWNLFQLANALYPLINEAEGLESILEAFSDLYDEEYKEMMLSKLGISTSKEADNKIISDLETNLQLSETDMTIFFRNLNKIKKLTQRINMISFKEWLKHNKVIIQSDKNIINEKKKKKSKIPLEMFPGKKVVMGDIGWF